MKSLASARTCAACFEGIAERPVKIGFQTRIDLWNEDTLDLLGRAHCISMECGVESITHEGREDLNKNCRLGTDRIAELLVYARGRIPWVQANLILTERDDRAEIHRWQQELKSKGVWVSEPVPMFPFPGSPLYTPDVCRSPGRYGMGTRPSPLHIDVCGQGLQRHSGANAAGD